LFLDNFKEGEKSTLYLRLDFSDPEAWKLHSDNSTFKVQEHISGWKLCFKTLLFAGQNLTDDCGNLHVNNPCTNNYWEK